MPEPKKKFEEIPYCFYCNKNLRELSETSGNDVVLYNIAVCGIHHICVPCSKKNLHHTHREQCKKK